MGCLLKFQQYAALQKHIQDSSSLKQTTRLFLIIHPQREERRKLLENLSGEIKQYNSGATTLFLEAEQVEWGQVHDSLMTPSLFGEDEIVIWNGLKNLSESVLDKIRDYILNPSPSAFFLMGAESAKGFSDLYQKTKKELVLLDFSDEKPWNKEKRVQSEMVRLVQKEGKSILPDAFSRLTFLSGSDPLILESELIKIITYVGDRKEISVKDVDAICASSSIATGWQLSEGLVWEDTLSLSETSIDLTFLLSFLGQVRFYLQQGRQVGWCLQQKKDFEETSKFLPQLKIAQFQKVRSALRSRKMAYFDAALESLYEVELLSKNSNMTPAFLFNLLQTKLTHLKQANTR
jgi:DNA polymerase III subunit delta